ncbi:MAG TPA: hypothetical protein VF081_09485 [Solirubrobacterales bacterium]
MLNLAFANRRRSTIFRSSLALLALAALALPVAAAAKTKGPDRPPRFGTEMHLKGSHGYSVGITALDHRTVSIIASNDSASATYSVAGRASRDGIEANFGKFGRISVRFTPSNEQARRGRKRNCRVLHGHFDGVIKFRGEAGYTQITAQRANGVIDLREASCFTDRPLPTSNRELLARADETDLSLTALGAVAHTGGRTVAFEDVELSETDPDGKTAGVFAISLASVVEHRGRISISRAAFLLLGRSVTTPSPPGQQPQTATVKLPKPFHGTGSYLAAPGAAPTWTGDLSVPLPGAGTVPLTGPEFDALLCAGPSSKANSACLRDFKDLMSTSEAGTAFLTSFGTQAPAVASPFFE